MILRSVGSLTLGNPERYRKIYSVTLAYTLNKDVS